MKNKRLHKSSVEIDLLEMFYDAYTQDISRNLLRNDLEAIDLQNIIEIANILAAKPEEALVLTAIVYQLKTKSLVKEHHLVAPNLIETQTKTIIFNLCQNEVTTKTMHSIGFNIQNAKNTQYALQSSLPK